ncbi:WD40 repeat-like protein [Polyporus arcularius HHB13444]|uniref:WD40 repeat-like protein n=1 Tax=Polyporus arcularius HHB13444 TaxID=1314778 RepID=A0A5C3NT46_9APHY|nr:WD40 repeat-like protein [Polyporus arcularius HHB13444]
MVLCYQEHRKLANGHTKGITKVVFSPDGTLLATGGLDGRICVWGVEKGVLCHAYSGTSEVLEVVWPATPPGLMCGLGDGHIAWMPFSEENVNIAGFFAHGYPVECLAPNNGRLASGAGPELSIWRWDSDAARYVRERTFDEPPKTSHNESKEVVVTSIHWITSQQRLAVTYLNHGICLFDSTTWMRVRTFPMNGFVASASISDDGALIAVSNVDRGFDIYSLASGDPLCTIKHKILRKVATPAIWIHGGFALLGGTTSGKLTVWDVTDFLRREDDDAAAEVRVLYELPIPKEAEALAVAVSPRSRCMNC